MALVSNTHVYVLMYITSIVQRSQETERAKRVERIVHETYLCCWAVTDVSRIDETKRKKKLHPSRSRIFFSLTFSLTHTDENEDRGTSTSGTGHTAASHMPAVTGIGCLHSLDTHRCTWQAHRPATSTSPSLPYPPFLPPFSERLRLQSRCISLSTAVLSSQATVSLDLYHHCHHLEYYSVNQRIPGASPVIFLRRRRRGEVGDTGNAQTWHGLHRS